MVRMAAAVMFEVFFKPAKLALLRAINKIAAASNLTFLIMICSFPLVNSHTLRKSVVSTHSVTLPYFMKPFLKRDGERTNSEIVQTGN